MTFAPLTTRRLILSRLVMNDAPDVFAYRRLEEVRRYQGWEPDRVEEVESFIRDQMRLTPNTPDTWFQLSIRLRDEHPLIGDVGLHFPNDRNHEAEVGITVAPDHQRLGYATEALRAALDYLFENLGKHRVFASVDPRNHASMQLMDRMGFRKEAHFRESLWFKGAWADDVIFAMLDREWRDRTDISTP